MTSARLLAHFHRLSEAPDAVPRLRQLLLKLAIQGRLLPQDLSDRPPTEDLLLARGALAKKAAEAPRIRWKASEDVAEDDAPFSPPAGWVLARLNDTGLFINGLAFKPSDWGAKGLPIIRIQNLSDPTKPFNFAQGDYPDEVVVRDGDILVSWSATLDAFVWNRGPGVLNQHIFRVIPACELVDTRFLTLLLRQAIRDLSEGEHAHGLVMTHVNRGPFLSHVVAIPPRTEQQRIVAKVNELMALCDRLEAAQVERERWRGRLTAASAERLNESAGVGNASEHQEHVRFHLDHLSRIATRSDQVAALRRTILSLAVLGRLVPQDPNDEPAPELLKRILAEQSGLIRSGVLKPDRGDPGLSDDHPPFDVPPTWRWAQLGALIVFGPRNGVSPKPSSRPGAPRAITLTATTKGTFDSDHFKPVEANIPDESEMWLRPGDLLFQRGNTREYVGMAAYYTGKSNLFLYPDLMMKVRLSEEVSLRYCHLCAVAPYARAYFSSHATGAQETMPKINQATLNRLPIPVAPLAEQRRIVAKLDELMALCGSLDVHLANVRAESRHLLDAVLHEALALA
jgi:type I restriction enzyme S subunit